MQTESKYIAELKNVGEIALVGRTDLTYWQQKLCPLGLSPIEVNGRAEVTIYGIRSRWMGMPFRELTISVSVTDPSDASRPAYFLLQAYNSSRVLSFLERSLFHTPYRQAAVDLESTPSSVLYLQDRGGEILWLEMYHLGKPTRKQDVRWEGTIFLPPNDEDRCQRMFFASLSGEVESRLYDASVDVCDLHGSAKEMRPLLMSNFVPTEWRIRTAATHARSNTYLQETE